MSQGPDLGSCLFCCFPSEAVEACLRLAFKSMAPTASEPTPHLCQDLSSSWGLMRTGAASAPDRSSEMESRNCISWDPPGVSLMRYEAQRTGLDGLLFQAAHLKLRRVCKQPQTCSISLKLLLEVPWLMVAPSSTLTLLTRASTLPVSHSPTPSSDFHSICIYSYGDQKRVSDPLALDLQVFVS